MIRGVVMRIAPMNKMLKTVYQIGTAAVRLTFDKDRRNEKLMSRRLNHGSQLVSRADTTPTGGYRLTRR